MEILIKNLITIITKIEIPKKYPDFRRIKVLNCSINININQEL